MMKLSKPLLPIAFQYNWDVKQPLTPAELTQLAEQSQCFWCNEGELPSVADMELLKSMNPTYTVSVYVNAGHQGGKPANGWDALERDRKHFIQMYLDTKLAADITADTETIPVASAANIPPSGGQATGDLSLDASTGPTGKFISFIRIGGELMRVRAKAGNTLTVTRGTDGTEKAAHDAGVKVYAPVYVRDSQPDGSVALAKGWCRFSLAVGEPAVAEYMASVWVKKFMDKGMDGAFLDITAPSFYNMVDAMNVAIDEARPPYNFIDSADYTLVTRAKHHDLKIGRMQSWLTTNGYAMPFLIANNQGDGKWFQENGFGRLFAQANAKKLQPVNGCTLESPFTDPSPTNADSGHGYVGIGTWKWNIKTVADSTNHNLCAWPFIELNENAPIPKDIDPAIQAYSWACLLLAWGLKPGASRVAMQMLRRADNAVGRVINLPPCVYYDLGAPVGAGPDTDDTLDALMIGTNTYMRNWTKGAVLVNPSEADDSFTAFTGYRNQDGALVTVKALKAHTHRFLFL